jgi:hypothetical protein
MDPTTVDGVARAVPKPGERPLGTAAENARTRELRITTTSRHGVTGYLLTWAAKDPAEVDVSIQHLATRLVDVHHYADFEGQAVRVRRTGVNDGGEPVEEQLLVATLDCVPYAADPEPRVPTVSVNITPECWVSRLGPDELLCLASQLRAQAERLAEEVHSALVAARADWAARHEAGSAYAQGRLTVSPMQEGVVGPDEPRPTGSGT